MFRWQNIMRFVNKETLLEAHAKQSRRKVTGVDGVTKDEYDVDVHGHIDRLLERMKRFQYRPQPVWRTYIPKANGKLRPLGIPAYEDKLVQGVMANVLSDIYEGVFLDCSYGFRPGRSCHDVVRYLNQTIMTKKVNYVLGADIKGFFDNVNHDWLMRFLEHDIADRPYLRYVRRFLKAGIMEDGKHIESDRGTPQGGLISPTLANVYLHYVLDGLCIRIITVHPNSFYVERQKEFENRNEDLRKNINELIKWASVVYHSTLKLQVHNTLETISSVREIYQKLADIF